MCFYSFDSVLIWVFMQDKIDPKCYWVLVDCANFWLFFRKHQNRQVLLRYHLLVQVKLFTVNLSLSVCWNWSLKDGLHEDRGSNQVRSCSGRLERLHPIRQEQLLRRVSNRRRPVLRRWHHLRQRRRERNRSSSAARDVRKRRAVLPAESFALLHRHRPLSHCFLQVLLLREPPIRGPRPGPRLRSHQNDSEELQAVRQLPDSCQEQLDQAFVTSKLGIILLLQFFSLWRAFQNSWCVLEWLIYLVQLLWTISLDSISPCGPLYEEPSIIFPQKRSFFL